MQRLRLRPQVKEKFRQRDESFKPFAGKTMAMIFTKPSMRTRISFETVSYMEPNIRRDPLVNFDHPL